MRRDPCRARSRNGLRPGPHRDLGRATAVGHIRLGWEAAYAKAYRVQVSNDGAMWTDLYSTTTGK